MLRHLVDLVFPSACYSCGRFSEPAAPLCWRCVERLEPLGSIDSTTLAPPADVLPLPVYCGWRFEKSGPLADVVHALKYENRPWLGGILGFALAQQMLVAGPSRCDVIVPIPLHRLKRLERGYNQAEWIGRSLSRHLECELRPQALRRIKPTGTQTSLSREERWRNVQDAFDAPERSFGESVLLVDDVITTGATIYAAAVRLRRAGYSDVRAASIALSSN